MTLTEGYISRIKILETSQFIFLPTNIDLLIKKYYFCNNNQSLKNNTIRYTKTNKYFPQINYQQK